MRFTSRDKNQSFSRRKGGGLLSGDRGATIISAIIAPSLLAALYAGNDTNDIPAIYSGDMDDAANYASTVSTIDDSVLVEISINGGVRGELPVSPVTLEADDVVAVWVTVTDLLGNERVWFAGSATVAAAQFTAAVAPVLSGSLYAGYDTDDIPAAYSANMGATANYTSTAGTISSAVVTVSINGGAFAALPGSPAALSEDDTVQARVTVTDSEANVEIYTTNTLTVLAASAAYATSVVATPTGGTTAQLDIVAGPVGADVYWFVSTSATPPSAANLKAGTGAVDFGTYEVTTAPASFEGPAGLTAATLYYVYVLSSLLGTDSAITSDSFTTEAADATAPVLSAATITVLDETSLELGWDTTEQRGKTWVLVSTVNSAPNATQIKAGQDGSGTTTNVKWTAGGGSGQAVTASTTQIATALSLTEVVHYAWAYQEDPTANGSNVLSLGSATPADVSGPLISSLDLDETNDTAFGGTFNTDSAEGTFDLVLTAYEGQPPTATQIKAGQDHLGATAPGRVDSFVVTSSGHVNFTGGVVTASGSFWAYAVHTDAVGNESDVLECPYLLPMVGPAAAHEMSILFDASEIGALYDPYRTTSLWQDTARTIPATLHGDPIARIDDLSGNGRHLFVATGSPVLNISGAIRWIDGGGAAWTMTDSAGTRVWTSEDWYMVLALRMLNAGSSAYSSVLATTSAHSGTNAFGAYSRTSGATQIRASMRPGAGTVYTADDSFSGLNADFTAEAYHESNTLYSNIDGGTAGSAAADMVGTAGASTLTLGNSLHQMRFYGGLLVKRVATADEKTAARAWATYLRGTDTVPAPFLAADWSIADPATAGDLSVTISSLPNSHGDAITDVEYRVDGGSWTSSGGTTSFTISGLTDDVAYDVELRAVNAIGAGYPSDVKAETPTGASWLPSDLTLLMWIDASDTSTTFQDAAASTPAGVGDPVRRINDKANALHYLSSSDAKRPTLQADGLDFDGTDDALASSAALNLSATDAITIFAVVEPDTDAGGDFIIAELGPATGSYRFFLSRVGDDFGSASRGSQGVNANQKATSTTGYLAGTPRAVITDHDISLDATNNYVGGTLDGTASGEKGTGNFDAALTFYIGARAGTSLYFNGRIAEMFIIGSVADSTIRSNALAYFTSKWGT